MTGSRVVLSSDRTSAQRRGRLWLLLGVVLIALLAVHALSAHDAAGDHRTVSSVGAVTGGGLQAGGDTATADVGSHASFSAAPNSPAGDVHAIVAGCLFLLAAAVILLLTRLRETGRRPSAVFTARSGRRRGPPKRSVRLALCVERI